MSTLLTCVARFTGTLVAIDLVDTSPVITGIALAVIDVDFTVDSYHKILHLVNPKFQKNITLASLFLLALLYLWCP